MIEHCPTCRQPLTREPETLATAGGERTDAEGVDVAYGSIMLRGLENLPLVFGEEIPRLHRAEYRDVRALVLACRKFRAMDGAMAGIRLSDLVELFGAGGDCPRTFRRLRSKAEPWARAIRMAGGSWGGYSITPQRSEPTCTL